MSKRTDEQRAQDRMRLPGYRWLTIALMAYCVALCFQYSASTTGKRPVCLRLSLGCAALAIALLALQFALDVIPGQIRSSPRLPRRRIHPAVRIQIQYRVASPVLSRIHSPRMPIRDEITTALRKNL